MAKIENTTRRDIQLVTLHLIPRLGELEVDNAVLDMVDNIPTLASLSAVGDLVITRDEPVVVAVAEEEPKPKPPVKNSKG